MAHRGSLELLADLDLILIKQTTQNHHFSDVGNFQVSSADDVRLFSIADSFPDPDAKNFTLKVLNAAGQEALVVRGYGRGQMELMKGSEAFGSVEKEKVKGLLRCFENTKFLINRSAAKPDAVPELAVLEDDSRGALGCPGGADATFTILSHSGNPIGRIGRKGPRMGENTGPIETAITGEYGTEEDSYGSTFPADLSVGKKTLILAVTAVLGVKYFDNKIQYANY